MKLPARRARGGATHVAPPKRHVEEDPEERRHRGKEDEPRTDEDDERDKNPCGGQDEAEHAQLEPPHPAEQALVLIRRNLLAIPALAVGNTSGFAAFTGDRDGRILHPADSMAGWLMECVLEIETARRPWYGRRPGGQKKELPRQGGCGG